MKLGLCTIAGRELPLEDVVTVAADAGYDGIELWGKDHVGDGSPATCEEIRTMATDRGLEIPVYGSYLRVGTDDYEPTVEDELQIADRLDAAAIRVWAGEQEYQDRTDAHWDRVVADLVDLADRAERHGLEVTVEKHQGTLTNTHEGARRLVETVDREHVGLNWQPLFERSGAKLLDEASDLAPLSNNVHLQAVSTSGDAWQDRCLLEDAFFDVPAILEAFEDAGFDDYVEVEFVDEDLGFETASRRDLEYLASIVR